MSFGFSTRRKRRCRHGVLVQRSSGASSVVLLTWRLLEANMRLHSLGLGLHGLVGFCGPTAGAVSWRSTMSNVQAVDAALQAGIIHVEVPAIINGHSIHDAGRHSSSLAWLRVDSHGRCSASRGRWWPVNNGVKGFNSRETHIRLRA